MRAVSCALLILVASSLFGGPVITSVSPTSGSVEGGTVVSIYGSGFNDYCAICSPPFGGLSVFFGNTQVPSSNLRLFGSARIEAIAPPHPPGPVSITVSQMDGPEPRTFTVQNAFTYTGNWQAGFEPVLFPIFTPPIKGAFGSEFHTFARVASRGEPFDIFGVDGSCLTASPVVLPDQPFRIGSAETILNPVCSQAVGRLFFVANADADDLAANLRVTDVTRQGQSHGVEVPVARLADFTTKKIVLMGVPVDSRFRNTLRVYGLPGGAQFVNVTVNGVARTLPLQPGGSIYEPSYAQFTDFPTAAQLPAGQNTVTVTIDQPANGVVPPTAVWAFVSVTNNDTQQITTIAP